MQKNIILHEMAQYRNVSFLWVITILFFAYAFLALYTGLVEETDAFRDILAAFPEGLKQLTGFTDSVFTSSIGYYGLTFVYISLLGGIQAMSVGVSIVSKETTAKTAEFLFTKPVSREQIFLSKFTAATCVLLATNVLMFLSLLLMVDQSFSDPPRFRVFALATVTLFFVQFFFQVLGMLMGVTLRKVKTVIAVSLPTVLGFYIVGMLDTVIGKESVRYFTPFKFFNFEYINEHLTYEWQFVLLEIILVSLMLYYIRRVYISRDIDAV